MTFTLPPESLSCLDQLVEAGAYPSRQDALIAAIDLMRRHSERVKQFRNEFEESIAQSDAGEVAPIELDDILAESRRIFEQRHLK